MHKQSSLTSLPGRELQHTSVSNDDAFEMRNESTRPVLQLVSQEGNFSQITPCLPSALVGCTRLSFLHADPTRVGRQHAEQARPLRGASGPTAPPPTPRRPVGPLAGSPQSRWVRARRMCPMASKARVIQSRNALKLTRHARTHLRCAHNSALAHSPDEDPHRSPKTLNRSHQSYQSVLPETRMRFPCAPRPRTATTPANASRPSLSVTPWSACGAHPPAPKTACA
jgi:hypothetical protein